jgi:PAS domain-containing protein
MPDRASTAGAGSHRGRSFLSEGGESAVRSSLVLIWLGAAALTALFLAFVGWSAYQSHGRTIRSARSSIENIALLLEHHTARTVSAADLVLQVLLTEQQLDPAANSTDFERLMTPLLFRTPQVETVRLLDQTTGGMLAGLGGAAGPANDTDLEAMRAFTADADLALHIGDPKRREGDRTWRVGISRRQVSADGKGIIAVAQVSLGELQRAYDEIQIGAAGSIVLFRSDAMMLARAPSADANVGRRFPKAALFTQQLPRAPQGVYETSAASDDVERIIAFRKLPDLPLVLLAGVSQDEVLGQWRDETLSNLVLLPLAMAFLLAFGFLLSREATRRDEAEARVTEKNAILEATLENMDQGLLMVDSDLRVQVCNRRAMELLDLPPEFMASKPHFDDVTYRQFQTGEFENAEEAFRRWVESGGFERTQHVYERERPNGTVLEIRTLPIANGGAVRTYADVTPAREWNRSFARPRPNIGRCSRTRSSASTAQVPRAGSSGQTRPWCA